MQHGDAMASSITTCMSCSTIRIVRSLAMRRTSCMVSWVSAALMPGGRLVEAQAAAARSQARCRSRDCAARRARDWRRVRRPCRASPTDSSAASAFSMMSGKARVVRDHVPGVPARLRGDAHVFQRGGVGQDVGDLVGARDALLRDAVGGQPGDVLAVEQDAAGGRPQHAGQAIEEGALAGAVRPDDGADLAALDLEIDAWKARPGRRSGRSAVRS